MTNSKRTITTPDRVYLGIDNGVTGSVAMVSGIGLRMFIPVPTVSTLNFQKTKHMIRRVDVPKLLDVLGEWTSTAGMTAAGYVSPIPRIIALIERPFMSPKGFVATVSAVRCLEATLILLETMGISYRYVDSREWQKVMLPSGCKGKDLKMASKEVGIRLFPTLRDEIIRHKDADSLLIAEWGRLGGL